MKLTVVLMIFGMVQISASTYSQNVKLNLKRGQNTLQHVFNEIEKQSTFTIFYQDDQVNLNKEIAQNLQGGELVEVLDKALEGTGLTYKINDKIIIILEEKTNRTVQQDVTITVKGRVMGVDGEPLPGVNVFIEGTTTGTITNIDGDYELAVEGADKNIVYSFIGYQTQTIAVNGRSQIDITLVEESIGLDEVVAVGYGVQKKSDLTGAVASVKSDDLQKIATTNASEQLQGRMAGVSVIKSGGSPGAGVYVKVRGVGTVGNNNPLYIIDGIPGSLYFVNPSDIERMEVLKDGAAAAIYGSRAANGVILVTTKKGKEGKAKVDIESYVGSVNANDQYDLLDAQGYRDVHKMMVDNYNMYVSDANKEQMPAYVTSPGDYPHNTDWQDQVFRSALIQNHTARVSGGNELGNYSLSAGYADEEGTVIGSDFQKYNFRSRTTIKKGRFEFDGNVAYSETKREDYSLSLRETYHISPLIPVYDDTQESGFGQAYGDLPAHNNPVGVDHFNENETRIQFFVGNLISKLELTDWLSYQLNLGFQNSNEHENSFHPPYIINIKEQDYQFSNVYNKKTNWRERIAEHLLQFNKDFNNHSVQAVAGYTATKQTSEWMWANVEGSKIDEDGNKVQVPFLDENFKTLDAGEGGTYTAGGSNYTYTRTSVLGRINYSYMGKYLFQASVRRDGSSKFGENNRYGTFPSFALGWRVSEESFMDNVGIISNLKLRGSWGKLGNEITLDYYDHQSLITTLNKYWGGYVQGAGQLPWIGSIANDLENRNLQWETTISTNIGVDFGLFNNKLSGVLNYYRNDTEDMLVLQRMPSSAGVDDPILNVGKIRNSGIEIELNYRNKIGQLGYNITGTLSTLNNEVLELAEKDQVLYGAGLKYGSTHIPTQTREGYEIGSFFLYQADGIFQSMDEVNAHVNKDGDLLQANAKPGDVRFKDMDGDGDIDVDDRTYSGTGLAKLEYGINLGLDYKGFDFSMFWQGVSGNKIYNGNRFEMEGMDSRRNFLSSTLNAWTSDNTNTSMPRAVLNDPNLNNRESTRFLEDGAYLRLKTVQLGYTIPKQLTEKVGIERLRMYVSGQNLLTITDYSGLDPEVGRSSVLNTGVDRVLYPQTHSVLFGVQVGF
ncbi:TonB-dependent receptor [Carboxylicivirga sp. A043]|uniref:TonB-dependent receptor n=1 Tax=Carboxylicivirga litoralis TaxID=2816963 RepID=UPI0021CB29FF|nr:TonB-dependent receptor [Carboxylicivirga sp. A043]MCU4157486.1 TonB-dependent receptor [Carboxylicivirga sp. A043]